jgi:hypothetical protein
MDESLSFFDSPDESFLHAIGSPSFFTWDGLLSDLFVPPTLPSAEKQRIAKRLEGFDSQESLAYRELCRRFGTRLRREDLLTIARALTPPGVLRVDRDATRRKEVLLKWFDENWPVLEPRLGCMVLWPADITQPSKSPRLPFLFSQRHIN